jgi:hypothetical protein
MLEVLNLNSMLVAWNQFDLSGPMPAVPLEEHWILPQAGMEIINAGRTAHWIPSPDTNRILPLHEPGGVSCAVALADGTVGIIRAAVKEDDVSWGVFRDADQLLLSFPCIGMGSVVCEDIEQKISSRTYLACCLRGATTYLVPLQPEAEPGTMSEIRVIGYPHDLDAETTIQQLQGFTAGNIPSELTPGGSIPALVYAWPGGIIDIYAAHLLPSSGYPRSIVEELMLNGSVEMLKTLLATKEVWDENSWQAARKEVSSLTDPINIADLCSDRLTAFRTILLQLARASPSVSSDAIR